MWTDRLETKVAILFASYLIVCSLSRLIDWSPLPANHHLLIWACHNVEDSNSDFSITIKSFVFLSVFLVAKLH